MSQYGAVFYSSQWTGWVPGSCGGDGNLGASSFSVSNVRIQGKVVQGPEPTRCAPLPTPAPTPTTPAPSPAPVPTPVPTNPSPMGGQLMEEAELARRRPLTLQEDLLN